MYKIGALSDALCARASWTAYDGRNKLAKALALMKVPKRKLTAQLLKENKQYAMIITEHQTFRTLALPDGPEKIVKMGMVEITAAMKMCGELMLNPHNESGDFANYLNAMNLAQKSLLLSAKCLKEMEQSKITNDQTASQDQTRIPASARASNSEEPR